jgi:hypothetical protein
MKGMWGRLGPKPVESSLQNHRHPAFTMLRGHFVTSMGYLNTLLAG